ncbi:SatD family protein [Sediminibacterium ginsengisoli]|uniref:SatD family (SatD) n=1 Tax=Sediminibacterium ginsengisoli TaxID=413434 RepID=A0A1T4LEW5_9BACT|nr:SatD family protein [Sediminibacterium ginsengisoli]SJZ53161.1 SatD family (SatD) [Sediminibacterium ginsengisoli]
MTSIITGDIINSRGLINQQKWIAPLKKILTDYGRSPKSWEIYRGDSFQLEIKKPELSLLAAIRIKACIRAVPGLDVRMAIGIGEKSYDAPRITESNGSAFINSGEQFELLKKIRKNLAVGSPWLELDAEINMMISLASIAMDRWSHSSAEIITLSLLYQDLSQKELGDKINRSQSSVSERQTRASYSEIMELEKFYRKKIMQQLQI